MNNRIIILLCAVIILAGIALLMPKFSSMSFAPEASDQRMRGGANRTVDASGEAAIGGSFTLEDTEGNTVTEQALLGRYALVYFGFTYCPDICPTTLLNITQALNALGDVAERVQPVFITVDPKRDSKAALKAYASNFHPSLLALRGSEQEVDEAAKAYKVYYRLNNQEDTQNYTVDHSGFVYLMDPKGRYLTHFTHEDSGETIMTILTKYIR